MSNSPRARPVELVLQALSASNRRFSFGGPKRIPDLARAIGQARGEFERASREYVNPAATVSAPTSDDILIETAKKLGINTEGKTKEQISQEIINASKPKTP